ncbi:MT-A70 family methyltransferase [Actinomyces naeslundii]|uniref:MT-A70 family methyltransferase n=1 Tax=Actinomyces naeslundii TaxID=1655 RepID=UPI0021507A78|nr:MT-A70 family methyltransferase [Actinomyces naeslundii]
MQQQTKQAAQRCAGGAASRRGDVARQAGAATKPDTGMARLSGAVSAGAATSAALLSQDSASKAAGSGRKTSVLTEGTDSSPAIPGLLPGGFATILVDPPWPLQSGEKHYRTMSLARIKALPVGRLAARDAHLWLWTTNALLPKAYEVAEAWGFTVRSPLTWVKFRLGLGGRYQLRNATEQLLFCTRGKAPLGSRSQPTWFNAPVTEHSRKPAEQFAIIERVSPGPYLELFARRRPESNQPWAVWGDQVDSDIRIPGFAVPRYSKRAHEAEAETPTTTAERVKSVQTAAAGASRGDDRDDSADGNGKEVEQ